MNFFPLNFINFVKKIYRTMHKNIIQIDATIFFTYRFVKNKKLVNIVKRLQKLRRTIEENVNIRVLL